MKKRILAVALILLIIAVTALITGFAVKNSMEKPYADKGLTDEQAVDFRNILEIPDNYALETLQDVVDYVTQVLYEDATVISTVTWEK